MSFHNKHVSTVEVPSTLNPETLSVFCEQWERIDFNDTKIVVLQSGSKEHFCLGMDILWAAENSGRTIQPFVDQFADFMRTLMTCPSILMGVARGKTIGGGVGILSICDVVIASNDTEYQLPECLFGFVPGIILPSLLNRLSAKQIKALCLSAQTISAVQAKEIGLIDKLSSSDNIQSTLEQTIKQYGKCKLNAIKDLKELLNLNTRTETHVDECLSAGVESLCERLKDPSVVEKLQNLTYAMNEV